jgi:LacI family transcriptional regulator
LVDDLEGAYEVTEHLISRGCSNIVFLNGPSHLQICQKRLEGYRIALLQNNIPPLPGNILFGGLTTDESLHYSKKLFDLKTMPDAIFAINDQVAVGAIKTLKSRGIKIPEEIMVAGFSDQPYSSLIEPSLTSLEHPTHEIGIEACKLIMEQIEKEEISPKTIILKGKLVTRDSTGKKKPVH